MGAQFDKLCDISKKRGGLSFFNGSITLSQIIKRCHLFEVDYSIIEANKEYMTDLEDTGNEDTEIPLPFNITAFEFDDSIIVIISDGAKKLLDDFKFILITSEGIIANTWHESTNTYNITENYVFGDRNSLQATDQDYIHKAVCANANISYILLKTLKDPSYFIIEEIPEGKSKRSKFTQQKTKYRSKYILLKPQQARTLMCIDQIEQSCERAKPITHERRGHWRRLTDDRFNRNEDGSVKSVWVKPTWVGQSEAVVDGKIYKVLMNK